MRPLIFVVALLSLAAGARAQPKSKTLDDLQKQSGKDGGNPVPIPEGKAVDDVKAPLTGCDAKQQTEVAAAIAAARAKVDSCLAGFNPKMAAEIAKQFPKFKFQCEQTPRSEGAVTDHETDAHGRLTSATIKLTMHSRMVQYSREARLFHEMIHAIDPPSRDRAAASGRDGRYIISASRHATAGFPDPVYGCQFSCYPDGIGEDEGKEITRYNRLLSSSAGGLKLPEGKKPVDCPAGAQYCALYAPNYAGLCETGKPVFPSDLVAKDRVANRPTCLIEALVNSCPAADGVACASAKPPSGPLCALTCETVLAQEANGGRMPRKTADRLYAIGGKLSAAIDDGGAGLEGDDKALYAAAQRKGFLAACR